MSFGLSVKKFYLASEAGNVTKKYTLIPVLGGSRGGAVGGIEVIFPRKIASQCEA